MQRALDLLRFSRDHLGAAVTSEDISNAARLLASDGGVHEFYRLDWAATGADAIVRSAACDVATAIRSRLPPEALFWHDKTARQGDLTYYRESRHRRIPQWTVANEAILLSLCASPNGYTRETAVSRFSGVTDVSADVVFALLARTSDWVLAVRRAAEPLVDAVLNELDLAALLDLLPVLVHLQYRDRSADNPSVTRAIERISASPPADLFALFTSPAVARRRAALEIVLADRELLESPTCFWAVLASPDPIVRGRVVRELLTGDVAAEVAGCLPRLLNDSSAAVRLQALLWCADNRDSDWIERLDKLCFDPAGNVQDAATFHLEKARPGRPRSLFRAALQTRATASATRAALRGIVAMWDGAGGVELVLAYLDDHRGSVVRAALSALATRVETVPVDSILPLLLSPNRRISHAALRICLATAEGRAQALGVLETATEPLHRLRYYDLKQLNRGKWRRLEILLTAVSDTGPARPWARRLLRTWCQDFNRSFVTPAASTLERCTKLLDVTEALVGVELAQWLRDCCQTITR